MISIALFCKYPQHGDTDLRLGPLWLGQGDTGRQGEEPHDRSDDDDDGITEITSRVISSTGSSRLMMPHLTPLSPWLRWKLPWAWRQESGLRVEGARHAVTRYFCVSGDQCSVTSCAPLLLWSLIMTITSGEHSSPGPLSAADIFDFLRNNIWSSISFPLKIKSFGWMITKRVRYHCFYCMGINWFYS